MSEPMSSGEIEDVLSSIRRLVSEDLRPAARASAPAAPAQPAEKLLLTPALRVVRPEAEAPAEAAAEGEAAALPEAAPGAEPVPLPTLTLDPQFHSVRAAPAADAVAALGAAMGHDAVQDESGDETPAPAPVWPAEEAAFRHVEDEDELAALPSAAITPLDATDAWDALPEAAAPAPVEAEDWTPEAGDTLSEAEVFWQAEEAELVAAPGAPEDDARSWADAAEAEVLRELSEEAAAETVFARMDPIEDAVYDEELLRELVRDIIREELQGALGERITRNVRKLVRAEIARALAVRDFE